MQQIDLNNKIVIYQSEDGKTQLDVKLEGETVWLNRQQLAELFQLSQNLRQLPQTEKTIKLNTIILRW